MRRSLLLMAVVLVAMAGSASAQDYTDGDALLLGMYMPFDFAGGGVRAEGMAGASLALAEDIAGGTWNPAALVIHEGPKLGISYGSLSPSGLTDLTVNSVKWSLDHSGSLTSVSDINFVAPFRVKGHPFVGSFNYSTSFQGMGGLTFGLQVVDTIPVLRNNILSWEEFDIDVTNEQSFEGTVNTVNFSFGTRLHETVSMGIGVNIYSGQAISDYAQVVSLEDYPLPPYEQEIRIDIDTLTIDTSKFSGFNFTLGLKRTGEKFNAALVVRTPFSLNVKTGSSIYSVQYHNGLSVIENSDTTFIDNQLTKYGIPLTIGLGGAYYLKENLVLALDAEYRSYGGTEIKTRDEMVITPAGNIEEVFTDYDPEWNNGVALRLGAEWNLEKGIGTIPLRMGVGFIPTPVPNSNGTETPKMNAVIPHAILAPLADALNSDDTPMEYSFSLGTGIHWSQIRLDWSYTYSRLDRDIHFDDNWNRDDDVNIRDGVIKNRDHRIGFSFTGVF